MFADRAEAGRRLGERLRALDLPDPVVLALVRGGVPVGFEVARALGAPLDIVLVRKLGHRHQPEFAVGAVVDGDRPETVLNPEFADLEDAEESWLRDEVARQLGEIERRRARYLGGRTRPELAGRSAILVDDGIATGATMRAAIRAVRRHAPARIVVAAPVCAPDSAVALAAEADAAVCLEAPDAFGAVGRFYRDFAQIEDDEVIALLSRAAGAG